MVSSVLLVAPPGELRDALDRAFAARRWATHYVSDAVGAAMVLGRLRVDIVVVLADGERTGPLLHGIRPITAVPLLVLAAQPDAATASAAVLWTEAGADDWVPLPDSTAAAEVVVTRADDLCRRGGHGEHRLLRHDMLSLEPRGRVVQVGPKTVRLTRTEFDLLALLMTNPQRVVSRNEMLATVWGDWFGDDHTVEVHLSRLRRKILDAGGPRVAQSLPGVGYRLTDDRAT